MKFVSLVVISFLFMTLPWNVRADGGKGRWSAETSVTYPFVRIYSIQASYQFWERGEVLLGLAFQNWEGKPGGAFDVPGTEEAYTLLAGYRQYLWRGLNLELLFWPAYSRFFSKFDNQRHSGYNLWTEIYLGYKIPFRLGKLEAFFRQVRANE